MTALAQLRSTWADRPRPAGWTIIARKELADTLLSARFYLLVTVIGLTTIGAVQAASSTIRDAAPTAAEDPSLFLRLFTVAPEDLPAFFSFFGLVGLLAPLLGIAFGFDAISSERTQGTLPRLVSQPVHRDDIINGKFAAGLAVIGTVLVVVAALVTGLGILRLGLTPDPGEVTRLIAYLVVAVVYAGVWLAFAVLCSVVLRRAATAALATIAVWLVFTLFWPLLVGLAANTIAPAGEEATFDQQVRNVRVEVTVDRFSPQTLYQEASTALLSPDVRSLDVLLPEQLERAVPGELGFAQSILIASTQIAILIALIVVLFVTAYVLFLRTEIRA
jgi:ABC-2 type transport system permease protein